MTIELKRCIVRILNSQGQTRGTGFVLTDDGLIVTCAHVIASLGVKKDNIVQLVFHHTGDQITATIEPDGWRKPEAEDIAILRLDGTLPQGVQPVPFGQSPQVGGSDFEAFGYPQIGDFEGVWAKGKILGTITNARGMPILQLRSEEIKEGMSGAPVLDTDRQEVVGMVNATYYPLEDNPKFHHAAFAIPMEAIAIVCPELDLKSLLQTHLTTLTNMYRWSNTGIWLNEVGQLLPLYASPYDEDDAWEEDDLLRIIRNHSPVIILGEPGTGKTTALEQLVWQMARTSSSIIPVMVPLADYSTNLRDSVRDALNETSTLKLISDTDLEEFLEIHPCRLMFDGLNEVPSSLQAQIGGELIRFIRTHANRHYFVITSRSQDRLWQWLRQRLEKTRIQEAVTAVIRPLKESDIQVYLRECLEDSQKADEIYAEMGERMRALAQRPLMLMMIGQTAIAGERIPGNRGQLVDGSIRRALRREDKLKQREQGATIAWETKRKGLAALAWQMQREGLLRYDTYSATKLVERTLRKGDPSAVVVINEAKINGLLLGERQLRFSHQLIQEHFVALAMQPLIEKELSKGTIGSWGRDLTRSLIQSAEINLAEEKRKRKQSFSDFLPQYPWPTYSQACKDLESLRIIGGCSMVIFLILLPCVWLFFGRQAMFYAAIVPGISLLLYVGLPVLLLLYRWIKFILVKPIWFFIRWLLSRLWAKVELWEIAANRAFSRWAKRFIFKDSGSELLVLFPQQDWWNESFIQLSGLINQPNALVREISLINPWLAYWCLIEGKPANKETGRLVNKTTINALSNRSQNQRLRAVQALARFESPRAEDIVLRTLQTETVLAVRQRMLAILARRWNLPTLTRLGDKKVEVRRDAIVKLTNSGDERVTGILITVLQDKDSRVRKGVVEALGEIGDNRVIEPLIERLQDQNDTVRSAAVEALGKIGGPAIAPLIEQLQDQNAVLPAVVGALGKIGEPAVTPLVELLQDQNDTVRRAVVEVLGKIGEPAVRPLIEQLRDQNVTIRQNVFEALVKIGEPVVEPLIEQLQVQNLTIRQDVFEALVKIGEPAVEPLIARLQDQDATIRHFALETLQKIDRPAVMALTQIGEAWAVMPLVVWLQHKDPTVRRDVVEALGRIGDSLAVKPLVQCLSDEDVNVREAVAVALGAIGGEQAVEPLIEQLSDKAATVRRAAAEALGEIGDERAVKPLVEQLFDEDDIVHLKVVEALIKIGKPPVWPLLERLSDEDATVRRVAAEALGEIGDERAVEPLVEQLSDEDDIVHLKVVKALVKIGSRRAMEALVETLSDRIVGNRVVERLRGEDVTVRRAVTEALGRTGDIRVEEFLIIQLSDVDATVRRVAVEALGEIGDRRGVEPLVEQLSDEDEMVQNAAMTALVKIGEPAVWPLIRSLSQHRRAEAEILYQINERAAEPLIKPLIKQLLYPHTEVGREKAEILVAFFNKKAVERLIEQLQDEDVIVRQAAVEALVKIGQPTVEPLINNLPTENVNARRAIVDALSKIGGERTVELLIERLRYWDAGIQRTVAETLLEILKDKDEYKKICQIATEMLRNKIL